MIKLKKKKVDFLPLEKNGLNEVKRPVPVVVSLTSFPGRIDSVYKTIYTLLTQSLKPDILVLYLSESEFPQKEAELPHDLLNMRKVKNVYSHKEKSAEKQLRELKKCLGAD